MMGIATIVIIAALSIQTAQTFPKACPECHPRETAQGYELGLPFNVNCQTESNEALQRKLKKQKKRHGRWTTRAKAGRSVRP